MIKFLSASLIGALLPLFFNTSAKAAENLSGEFTYLGNDDVTVREHHYEYSDSYFDKKPEESPYELLKCSMDVSLAASRAEYIKALMDKLGFSYTDRVDEIAENINVLRGDKVTDSIYYPAQIIDGVDYYNSIAYGIGSKEIGDTTLILVAVRGSDYGIEWGGDFDIGTGENHEGFEIAANQVLDGLKNFITAEKITGKIKIWTCGYSRGAATANLLAAKLNEDAIDGIGKENVYAFCFECPRTTRNKDALSSDYDNIICVTNPDDIVPKVAMGIWGYKRFGKTHHIPAYQSDADYENAAKRKDVEEEKILGKILNTAIDAEYQLNEFVEDLAVTAVSPEYYVKHYQDSLIRIAMATFGHPGSRPSQADYLAIRRLEEGIGSLNPQNTREIMTLLGAKGDDMRVIDDSPLLNVHNMENTLSWIDSFKDYSDFGPDCNYILFVDNVEDMTVTDESGATVVSIVDGRAQSIDGGLFVRVADSGQFAVIFPENAAYSFTLEKSDKKYAMLSLCRFDMALGYPSEVYDYNNITLGEDMKISGEISGGELTLRKGSKTYKPEKVYRGEDVKLITITGESRGRGLVLGGGVYTLGEKAALVAMPETGFSFDGWYEGDKKISNQQKYIFRVERDLRLRAEFSQR